MTERAHAVSPVAKVLGAMRNFPAMPKAPPSGELANAVSLRGFVPRSAALSQKAALQMPFAVTTPFVKKVAQKRPQAFLSHKL